jgi:hypothetical protein
MRPRDLFTMANVDVAMAGPPAFSDHSAWVDVDMKSILHDQQVGEVVKTSGPDMIRWPSLRQLAVGGEIRE